jgi:hypothetical protein
VNVAVMNVGKMRVRVGNRRVLMWMGVRFFPIPFKVVRVPVMLVVSVSMVVSKRLVSVGMLMPLTDMKPDSQSHERSCNPERQRWYFRPENKR